MANAFARPVPLEMVISPMCVRLLRDTPALPST
jgi:hypothetical protein